MDKFFAKLDPNVKNCPDDCWEWRGVVGNTGYPRLGNRSATHIALEIDGRGRPSPEHHALHSCDFKTCVNPRHLRWGTTQENARDHRLRSPLARNWLTDEQVAEVRMSPLRNFELARKFGVSQACICSIRKNRYRRFMS